MVIKKIHTSFFVSYAVPAFGYLIDFSHRYFLPWQWFPTALKPIKLPEIFLRKKAGIIQKKIPWRNLLLENLSFSLLSARI